MEIKWNERDKEQLYRWLVVQFYVNCVNNAIDIKQCIGALVNYIMLSRHNII